MTNKTHTPISLGAVFTRPWAVHLVLDMAGYTAAADLGAGTAIEPSCGGGAFITAMIDRLAASCARHGHDLSSTSNAIWARDLDPHAVDASRSAAATTLRSHGVTPARAEELAAHWIQEGDFLLQDCPPADWVVGNPPYVRLEHTPAERSSAYRSRWITMNGRADIYVGFMEAGLDALKPDGTLSYICADRWMRNQYGKRLRQKIETSFAVDSVITVHDADPFEKRVAAYPAIFTLRSGRQHSALVADADASFNEEGAHHLVHQHRTSDATPRVVTGPGYTATLNTPWPCGRPSWPSGTPESLALINTLERNHPAIGDPDSGITVGIGLTTGADSIYLTEDVPVEPERLLPIVTARDIRDGSVRTSRTRLVNPWNDNGLVDLNAYPRTQAYLTAHETHLRARHIGKRQPDRWYRTIDRPITGLADTPKLLLADLRPRVSPVLENQGLYPHKNLFWITSDLWDLRVLGGLLLSDYATLFIETYSPRMAGGALRITAQYIRRIRVPNWDTISAADREQLCDAFDARNIDAANDVAHRAYGIRR